ncbi:MAG TPA: alpha/beta hydrolase, partial [Phenylobacterium sp.]|nr:alpha/beta hydrolase [Phenylobacterium sp.]
MASPGTQRLVVRTLLSLPAPVLRLMSGGGVVYQGGRTLDPRLQYLASQARGAPSMTTLSPEEARRASADALANMTGDPEPGVRVEPLTIPGPGGAIPARLYRPANQDPETPVLVFAHMGGGVIGDLETCLAFCTILALDARCPVLSV